MPIPRAQDTQLTLAVMIAALEARTSRECVQKLSCTCANLSFGKHIQTAKHPRHPPVEIADNGSFHPLIGTDKKYLAMQPDLYL